MEFRTFEITVNFGGYIGADETYSIYAESREQAEDDAIEEAANDLSVLDIEEVDDDEYEVTIGFCGMIGVEETYTVTADSEEDAEFEAMEEAKWDLSVSD